MKHKAKIDAPIKSPRSAGMNGTISVTQAASEMGAHRETILRHIRRGDFLAAKPLSDRGGWRIFEEPFRRWWSDRIGATSNRPAGKPRQGP